MIYLKKEKEKKMDFDLDLENIEDNFINLNKISQLTFDYGLVSLVNRFVNNKLLKVDIGKNHFNIANSQLALFFYDEFIKNHADVYLKKIANLLPEGFLRNVFGSIMISVYNNKLVGFISELIFVLILNRVLDGRGEIDILLVIQTLIIKYSVDQFVKIDQVEKIVDYKITEKKEKENLDNY